MLLVGDPFLSLLDEHDLNLKEKHTHRRSYWLHHPHKSYLKVTYTMLWPGSSPSNPAHTFDHGFVSLESTKSDLHLSTYISTILYVRLESLADTAPYELIPPSPRSRRNFMPLSIPVIMSMNAH